MSPAQNRLAPESLTKSFGAFYPEALLVRMDVDPKRFLDESWRKEFRARKPKLEEQVEVALASCAWHHEVRHFHDTFGTRAGINMFLAWMSVMDEFARVGARLAASQARWALPVQKAEASHLPDESRRFLKYALNVKLVCSRFRGELPSEFTGIEGLPDPLPHISHLREARLGTVFYAFPARATRITAAASVEAIQHIPLAFDAIIEGNAQAIQRTMIEKLWGPDVAQACFTRLGITMRAEGEAAYAPAYNVTDLMVTRYLENHGIKSFPRKVLLALADHALTAGVQIWRNPDGTRSTAMECAGVSFVDLLGSLEPAAVAAGEIPAPKEEGYLALLDHFANTPPSEEVKDEQTPSTDIQILYRWVAREVIKPLLDERLATGHRLFSDGDLWLTRVPKLPAPPFQIRRDGSLTSSAPPRVVEAWLRIRMWAQMLDQLTSGEPAVLCPRAHDLAPGITKINYAHTGTCDEYVAGELCGRFQPGIPAALPQCRFADTLRMLGFH